MKLSSPRRLLAAIASVGTVGLLSAGSANAAMITYTNSIPLQTAPQAFSAGFTLPEFNPAIGMLTGVSISLKSVITPGVSLITFFTPNPYTNAYATDMVILTAPTTDGDITQSASTGSYSGTLTATYPALTNIYDGSSVTDNNTVSVLVGNFPSYEGVGLLNFNYASGVSNDNVTGTDVFVGGAEMASAAASITYTYNPVPEPGSFGLLALGGIGLLIKRHKKA